MNIDERKQAFITLGCCLNAFGSNNEMKTDNIGGQGAYNLINKAIKQTCEENNWFIEANVHQAINAIATDMLNVDKLSNWLSYYPQLSSKISADKKVGIIMAGNIPLVGFHDLLCVLLCGHKAIIKTSSKDNVLIRLLALFLCNIEPRFKPYIEFISQRPESIDAVISTGSNNSARYFESWYNNIPHIIRKNRSSVAIITGNETKEELQQLGKDIFSYFGLGCRNVSALFVPQNYNFEHFNNAFSYYSTIFEHQGYVDCYRYQKAVMEMDEIPYYDTKFLLLKNSSSLSAPIALVNYQKYITLESVKELLNSQQDSIQCIVYQYNDIENSVKFGQTQHPQLYDYADGIDTINFLLKL